MALESTTAHEIPRRGGRECSPERDRVSQKSVDPVTDFSEGASRDASVAPPITEIIAAKRCNESKRSTFAEMLHELCGRIHFLTGEVEIDNVPFSFLRRLVWGSNSLSKCSRMFAHRCFSTTKEICEHCGATRIRSR